MVAFIDDRRPAGTGGTGVFGGNRSPAFGAEFRFSPFGDIGQGFQPGFSTGGVNTPRPPSFFPTTAPGPSGSIFPSLVGGSIPRGPGSPVAPSAAGTFGVGASGDPIELAGLQNILDILLGNGQVPRTALNQEISGIQRSGQSNQQQTQSVLAQRGLSGSALGPAINAAISANTGSQVAGREAAFTQEAEARRRQDLDLLFRLLGIRTDRQALATGQFQFDQNRSDQRDAADDSRDFQLLGLGIEELRDFFSRRRDNNAAGGGEPPPSIPGFDDPNGPIFF